MTTTMNMLLVRNDFCCDCLNRKGHGSDADLYLLLGSFHDAPKDLVKEIAELEKHFTVDTAKLKEITDHFEKELTKGMSPTHTRRIVSYG